MREAINAIKQKNPITMCAIGLDSVDINGDIRDTPPEKVLDNISMVPEFFGGTRFSSINNHAGNKPQVEVTNMKCKM